MSAQEFAESGEPEQVGRCLLCGGGVWADDDPDGPSVQVGAHTFHRGCAERFASDLEAAL